MKESKSLTKNKIQAVQQWLNQAEKNIDRDSSLQLQMDLFLAEAELRSTREKASGLSERIRPGILRQMLAFGFAVMVVISGMSGYLLWQEGKTVRDKIETPKQTLQPHNTFVVSPAIQTLTVAAPTEHHIPTVAVETQKPEQEVKSGDASSPKVVVPNAISEEEMKRLVQTAGQTLRGRIRQ